MAQLTVGRTAYTTNADHTQSALRTAPGSQQGLVAWLNPHTQVQVMGNPGTAEGAVWWKVATGPHQGYIREDRLVPLFQANEAIQLLPAGPWNIRPQPGDNHPASLGLFPAGTTLTALAGPVYAPAGGRTHPWWKVRLGDGREGYVLLNALGLRISGGTGTGGGGDMPPATDTFAIGQTVLPKTANTSWALFNAPNGSNVVAQVAGTTRLVVTSGPQVVATVKWYRVLATVNGRQVEGYMAAGSLVRG